MYYPFIYLGLMANQLGLNTAIVLCLFTNYYIMTQMYVLFKGAKCVGHTSVVFV